MLGVADSSELGKKKGCNEIRSLVVSEWAVEETSEGTRLDSIEGSDECSSLGIYE